MPKNEILKKAVEEIKACYDLKQAEIAERLDVTGSYLSDMINGRVPLTAKMMDKLAEIFQVNKVWLEKGIGDIISNSSVAMEPLPEYNTNRAKGDGSKIDINGYERLIKALEDTIAAKDETIASQLYAIEALKEEVAVLKKMAGFVSK